MVLTSVYKLNSEVGGTSGMKPVYIIYIYIYINQVFSFNGEIIL